VLRSLYLDLDRCNTSVTSPTLRFTRSSFRLCFRSGLYSPLLVGSTARLLASLLLLHALCLLPFDRQPSHLVYKPSTLAFCGGRLLACFSLLRSVASHLPFEHNAASVSLCVILSKSGCPFFDHRTSLSCDPLLQNNFSRRLLCSAFYLTKN
jgi:hypothetical protein